MNWIVIMLAVVISTLCSIITAKIYVKLVFKAMVDMESDLLNKFLEIEKIRSNKL